jgi:hypothetical protein
MFLIFILILCLLYYLQFILTYFEMSKKFLIFKILQKVHSNTYKLPFEYFIYFKYLTISPLNDSDPATHISKFSSL